MSDRFFLDLMARDGLVRKVDPDGRVWWVKPDDDVSSSIKPYPVDPVWAAHIKRIFGDPD